MQYERVIELQVEQNVRLMPLQAAEPRRAPTSREKVRDAWMVFATRPAQVIGSSALVFLGLQRTFLPMPLVLILIVMHRLALHLRTRKYLPPDQRANWGAVCVVTTLALVILPFYLAFTMYP